MSWEKEVDEIKRRRTLAQAQGGAAAIDKHHGRGKLTVRERIDAVLDGGSFREMGQMAGGAYLDEAGKVECFDPANYVLGLGQVDGRTVAIGGEDFTLKGGSPNAAGLRRRAFDVRKIIQAVVDSASVFQTAADFGPSIARALPEHCDWARYLPPKLAFRAKRRVAD